MRADENSQLLQADSTLNQAQGHEGPCYLAKGILESGQALGKRTSQA